MIAHHGELRRTIVYGRSGDAIVERVQVPCPPDIPDSTARRGDDLRLHHVMSNELVCAYDDLELGALTALLVRNHIGCIPIVDRLGRAVGMVTKSDLVEHMDAANHAVPHAREGRPTKRARDILMPVPFTLPESATLSQAAAMMVIEDVHHVLVVSEAGFLVGIVSTTDLVHSLSDRP